MSRCDNCKYLFIDNSVGFYECTKEDDFTDKEFEDIVEKEHYEKCPYFEEDLKYNIELDYLDKA